VFTNNLVIGNDGFRGRRYRRNLDNFPWIHLPACDLRILGIRPVRSMDHRFLGLESEEVEFSTVTAHSSRTVRSPVRRACGQQSPGTSELNQNVENL